MGPTDQPACVECQQSLLEVLSASPYLSNEEFWLARAEDVDRDGLKRENWSVLFRQAVRQHAIDVIADESATPQMVAKAAIVLASTAAHQAELAGEQQTQLIAALAHRITQATQNPAVDLPIVTLSNELRKGATPILPDVAWQSSGESTNPLVVLLNLVVKFSVQAQLHTELNSLHQAFSELPLAGTEYNQSIQTRAYLMSGYQPAYLQRLLQQTIYVQSGHLIGKPALALVSRFEQTLPADLAYEVEQQLDGLEFGTKKVINSSLERLSHLPISDHADRAVGLFKQIILRYDFNTRVLAIVLLSRAVGDQFFVHYAELLERNDISLRQFLLELDFSKFVEFRCRDPQALIPLMQWTDAVFASQADENRDQQMAVAAMLQTLLRDRATTVASQNRQDYQLAAGVVSEECQRVILAHLQNYPQLDDRNFWLAEPVYAERTIPLDFPFCQVMCQHAITVLEDDASTPAAEQLRARASMAVREAVEMYGKRELLSAEQRRKLLELLDRQLRTAAQDLAAAGQFFEVEPPFAMLVHPEISKNTARAVTGQFHYSLPACNPLIVSLNLIGQLAAQTELSEPLQLLHSAAAVQQSPRNDLTSGGESEWETLLQFAKNEGYTSELFEQVIYVQSGLLLGQDYHELLDRPMRIYREQEQAKLRTVQVRDTLAIFIPGLKSQASEHPVFQAGTRPPLAGYPVPVSDSGEINLPGYNVPGMRPLVVKGLDLNTVRDLVMQSVNDEYSKGVTVQFLLRAGEELELRNLTGAVQP